MRKTLILLLVLALVVPAAFAKGRRHHEHKVKAPCQEYTPDYEAGVGVDLVVYKIDQEEKDSLLKKFIPDKVTVEQKYDIANDVHSTFLVATYDLWDLWQNR